MTLWDVLDEWSSFETKLDPSGFSMKAIGAGYAVLAMLLGYGVASLLRSLALLEGPAIYDVYVGIALLVVGLLLRFSNAVRHQIIGDHTPPVTDVDANG